MRGRLSPGPRAVAWIGVPVAAAACLVTHLWVTAAALGVAAVLLGAAHAAARVSGTQRRATARDRLALAAVPTAGIFWTMAAVAILVTPTSRLASAARELHRLRGPSSLVLTHTHELAGWTTLIDVFVAAALVTSLLAARAVRRPRWPDTGSSQDELDRARAVVEEHGQDSLSPFILRPDKSFEFDSGSVAAYRVIGETVIVSGDPVGPEASAPAVLSSLQRRARDVGLDIVVYGASARHLEAYRGLGLRALRVGEEAVVDPSHFTLEGRPVRKLRQSVHRVRRRGWEIEILEGREIDSGLEAEIDVLGAKWRTEHDRILGFAMSMGSFELGVRPADVYALARSPDGTLRAVMRFLAHRGKLSLDEMRRVGETPNGLNEALVCLALQFARERGVPEVSLNYAGLAHLVRREPAGHPASKMLTRLALAGLRAHFQMDRLVVFNQKFSPEWRPRYLIYSSRAALPRAVLRVLQAEGYLPHGPRRRSWGRRRWLRPSSSAPAEGQLGG